MSDELSQLDELIESEVLEALGQEPVEPAEPVEENIDSSTSDEIDPLDILSKELDLGSDEEDGLEIPSEIMDMENSDDLEDAVQEVPSTEDRETSSSSTIEMNSVNSSDLASLLSQLLNNKTIEITIKIKD
jgi:hypothetical protein